MIPPAVTGFLIILAALLPRWSVLPVGQTAATPIASLAAGIAPTGLEFRPGPQPEIAVVGLDPRTRETWTGVLPHRIAPELQGYAGPIELLVGIDLGGRVTGVRILHHSETPTFVVGIEEPWFLDQFKGKTLDAPLKPGEDLDGITQATVTVETICEAVRRSLRFAALTRNPDGTRPTNQASEQAAGNDVTHLRSRSWRPWAALFGALVLAIIGRKLPRRLAALGHVLLIGFTGTVFLSLAHLAMALREPASIMRLPAYWHLFFLVSFLVLLLKPRGYCRFICPCGRLQDAIGPADTSGLPNAPLPNPGETITCHPRGLGRTLLWSGLLALALALVPAFPFERLELFAPLFLLRADAFAALLIIAVFMGSLLVPRFYCRTLCPLDPLFIDLERLRPSRTQPSSSSTAPAVPALPPSLPSSDTPSPPSPAPASPTSSSEAAP